MGRLFLLVVTLICSALVAASCSGKIAKTGSATVTGVTLDGVMRLNYADGKTALKRVNPDDVRKATKMAAENAFKPARYVETSQGSTLTFPCGTTLTYYDMPND
jgi:hypothetical protein